MNLEAMAAPSGVTIPWASYQTMDTATLTKTQTTTQSIFSL